MKALIILLLACAPARAELKAAAGKVDISPDLSRHKIYLSGYGAKGRRPVGVHDPLYARLALFSDGKKTLGVVGLDLLGFSRLDVEDLRRRAGFDGKERYLFVAATHQHAGPDTLGLWGPIIGISGVDRDYLNELKDKVAAELKRLQSELAPARVAAAETRLDPRGLCRDLRDPKVIDPTLGTVVVEARGKRLATIVNWSCHPEVLDKRNMLVTADFPGPLCERVERETGGACLYLSGSIGGLMSPDIPDGKENFYETHRIGSAVAEKALALAKTAQGGPQRLGFSSRLVRVPVENSRYLLFLRALTAGHTLLDAQGRPLPAWKTYWLPLRHLIRRLPAEKRPWIETEVSVLDLGPARVLGVPGEIFPELVIGGYDGRFSYGRPVLDPANQDPPDLEKAPGGPYLRDLIKGPVRLVVGLANDELGYIVPEYDFKVNPNVAMHPRPKGHHYEETNSVGSSATGLIRAAAAELLAK